MPPEERAQHFYMRSCRLRARDLLTIMILWDEEVCFLVHCVVLKIFSVPSHNSNAGESAEDQCDEF